MKNYYDILEVSQKASKEVIEKAYKVLAKKYHPDRYNGDKKKIAEEKLKEINVAYKILSDDLLRDQYDNEISKNKVVASSETPRKDKSKVTSTPKNKEDVKYKSVFDLLPESVKSIVNIFKNFKNIKRDDWFALGLTLLIMIVLGLLLWFLPFTHNWMYNNFIRAFQI